MGTRFLRDVDAVLRTAGYVLIDLHKELPADWGGTGRPRRPMGTPTAGAGARRGATCGPGRACTAPGSALMRTTYERPPRVALGRTRPGAGVRGAPPVPLPDAGEGRARSPQQLCVMPESLLRTLQRATQGLLFSQRAGGPPGTVRLGRGRAHACRDPPVARDPGAGTLPDDRGGRLSSRLSGGGGFHRRCIRPCGRPSPTFRCISMGGAHHGVCGRARRARAAGGLHDRRRRGVIPALRGQTVSCAGAGRPWLHLGAHMATATLVAYGWRPSAHLAPALMISSRFGQRCHAWREAGAHCP